MCILCSLFFLGFPLILLVESFDL